jgi:hypothetical protein
MGAFGSALVGGASGCLGGGTAFGTTFLGCVVLPAGGFFDRETTGFVGDAFGVIGFVTGGGSCGAAGAAGTGTGTWLMMGDGIPEGRDRCTSNR